MVSKDVHIRHQLAAQAVASRWQSFQPTHKQINVVRDFWESSERTQHCHLSPVWTKECRLTCAAVENRLWQMRHRLGAALLAQACFVSGPSPDSDKLLPAISAADRLQEATPTASSVHVRQASLLFYNPSPLQAPGAFTCSYHGLSPQPSSAYLS